jgi:ribosomal protein S18 acetylase RimI-like enzyme
MHLDRRPAAEADIPFLLSLRRTTMDGHLAASGMGTTDDAHLARLMHCFECAEILTLDGEPAGLFKLKRLPGEWEVMQLQLAPRLQGQGMGGSLLEEILADAARAGVDVKLSVLKANPAKLLYARLGFIVVGEDAHEYYMRHSTSKFPQADTAAGPV